jgi:hypothetical protein
LANEVTTKSYVDGLISSVIKLRASWNAATNSPNISGTTITGYAWIVSTAGATDLGGITDWEENDIAVKTDTGWLKIPAGVVDVQWEAISGDIELNTTLTARINELIGVAVSALTIPTSQGLDGNINVSDGSGGWTDSGVKATDIKQSQGSEETLNVSDGSGGWIDTEVKIVDLARAKKVTTVTSNASIRYCLEFTAQHHKL